MKDEINSDGFDIGVIKDFAQIPIRKYTYKIDQTKTIFSGPYAQDYEAIPRFESCFELNTSNNIYYVV